MAGRFYLGTPVSSTIKTDRHDITEILLKVELNTIKQTSKLNSTTQHILPYHSFIKLDITKYSSKSKDIGFRNNKIRQHKFDTSNT